MLQDDTLLKQIRKLVEAIARLRRNKREDEVHFGQTLDEELKRLTGLQPDLVAALGPQELRRMLSPGRTIDAFKATALAAIQIERASLHDRKDEEAAARRCRRQALELLVAVESEGPPEVFDEYLAHIDGLLDALGAGEDEDEDAPDDPTSPDEGDRSR